MPDSFSRLYAAIFVSAFTYKEIWAPLSQNLNNPLSENLNNIYTFYWNLVYEVAVFVNININIL